MLLRELITRFGFDVDTKNVKKYDNAMSGMMSKGKKLALLLGGTFSGKQLIGLGLTVKQTSEDLRRLAGKDFSQFASGINNVKTELEGIRKGSGDILPANTANALGSFFIENVGKSQENVKDFIQILKVASIAAINTRKSVSEVFTGLIDSRNNGGAEALLGLGGFNKQKQGSLEFKMETLASTNAPGGNLDRRIRGNLVRNELSGILPAMIKNLKAFDTELFSAKIAKSNVNEEVNKFANEATVRGTKFIESIFKVKEKSLFDAFLGFDEVTPVFKGGGKIRRDTNKPFLKNNNINSESNQDHTSNTIHRTEQNITNHNTFNITSDNPRKIGAIFDQKMNDMLHDARLKSLNNEDR